MKLIRRAIIATIILLFSIRNLIESLPNFKFSLPEGGGFSLTIILFNIGLLVYSVIQYFVIFGELLSRQLNKQPQQTEARNTNCSEENDDLTAFERIDATYVISRNDIKFLASSFIKMFAILIGVGLVFYVVAMIAVPIIKAVISRT